MRKILLSLLVCLPILAAGQGTSVRSLNGVATNLSAYDSAGTRSFNSNSRTAWDAGSSLCLDWNNRFGITSSGIVNAFGWANGFTSQDVVQGSPAAVPFGTSVTNGFSFDAGKSVDVIVSGTNFMQFSNAWVFINNALGSNCISISPSNTVGINTNTPIHALDVEKDFGASSGNANSGVPVFTAFKRSNGAGNNHNVFQVNCSAGDSPGFQIGVATGGAPFDAFNIFWIRNGTGGSHLQMSADGTPNGMTMFQDGHIEVQGDLLSPSSQAGVGMVGGLYVGNTNNHGFNNGVILATGTIESKSTLSMGGVQSNMVATVGTYGVATVFGNTNVNNTTASMTLGGIGTSPNLASHASLCRFNAAVWPSAASAATLTVTLAWTDEGGNAETANLETTAALTANTTQSIGPFNFTTAANTLVKVSTTLAGTSATYSFHCAVEVVMNQ